MYYSEICHYCAHCVGTHYSSDGLPYAHCGLANKKVLEFGMVCNKFNMIDDPKSRDIKSA